MKLHSVPVVALAYILASALWPAQAAESLLKQATYCHGFEENNAPKDVAKFFLQDEPVNLSIELNGRPKSGIVAARFLFRGELLAETQVDVATVNESVLFSFGQNTFVRFEVTHKEPLPVGACYSAIVTFDGKPLGTFPFKVSPPKGSLPSKLLSVTLAKGVDEKKAPVDETHEFEGTEKVHLVGIGDLGLSSWLEATWKVGGKVDEDGTRTFTIEENKAKVPFLFAFIPAGGWPAGTHEVSLQLDGQEVAHEKFTVKVGAPMAGATKLVIASSQLFQDDGKSEAGKEVKAFTTKDTELHVRWDLKQQTLVKCVQLAWVLVEADGEKEQVLVTVDVEAGVSDNITSALTAKQGLPPGKYRIDLLQDGKVVDTKPFEVK